MSKNHNRRIGDMPKFDVLTTEKLKEILRLDVEAPQKEELDTEEILYIMEVLTEREESNGYTGKSALEVFESFKQNYMSETDDTENPSQSNKKAKAKTRQSRWFRTLAATAAVLAIIFLGSITAKAFGVDIWETVVKWTQETFHFGEWGNSDTNNNLPYTSLREALEKGNASVELAPAWIPNGFEMVDISAEQTPLQKTYRAKYENGERLLRITVQEHLDNDPIYVEQSEGLVEEYEVLGITYYLLKNNTRTQAVWVVDSYECHILGDLTIEELKRMIDSIEKG